MVSSVLEKRKKENNVSRKGAEPQRKDDILQTLTPVTS